MRNFLLHYGHLINISLQINVVTQRGFVPVDERMRVIDGNGKLVLL